LAGWHHASSRLISSDTAGQKTDGAQRVRGPGVHFGPTSATPRTTGSKTAHEIIEEPLAVQGEPQPLGRQHRQPRVRQFRARGQGARHPAADHRQVQPACPRRAARQRPCRVRELPAARGALPAHAGRGAARTGRAPGPGQQQQDRDQDRQQNRAAGSGGSRRRPAGIRAGPEPRVGRTAESQTDQQTGARTGASDRQTGRQNEAAPRRPRMASATAQPQLRRGDRPIGRGWQHAGRDAGKRAQAAPQPQPPPPQGRRRRRARSPESSGQGSASSKGDDGGPPREAAE
jgi:hypothetical protein